MRMITAVIKHNRLEEVQRALTAIGVEGMTITEVKGFGKQKGHTEVYRGAEYKVRFLPKVKLDIAVPEDKLEETLEAILKEARTGNIGDGKIFVHKLTDVIRIRSGEKNREALG